MHHGILQFWMKSRMTYVCLVLVVFHLSLDVILYGVSIVTDNNELSAARVKDVDVTGNLFSTEIDAGVSELCWVDVEVTCDVRSVVHWRHAESRCKVVGDIEAAVDEVLETVTGVLIDGTRTIVVPIYVWTAGVTTTSKSHLWVLYDCDVQRSVNQRRCNTYTQYLVALTKHEADTSDYYGCRFGLVVAH